MRAASLAPPARMRRFVGWSKSGLMRAHVD
jgi:hypothetical protein